MKRRITTIEEYGGVAAEGRSVLQRAVDWLKGELPRVEFYPASEKRVFRGETGRYTTLAMADGYLYGSCYQPGCPRCVVGIDNFEPDEQPAKDRFSFALFAHNRAVTSKELGVAREMRATVSATRADQCRHCRAAASP